MRLYPAAFLLVLSACTGFPALEGTINAADRAAPYPRLTSLQPILRQVGTGADTDITDAGMAARVASLQARANQLRAYQFSALR